MKKFGVLIFAFALILSLGISALAAEIPESGTITSADRH